MRTKLILTVMALAIMPYFADAQGKGNGKGRGNGNGNGNGKNKAVKVTGNGHVKVRGNGNSKVYKNNGQVRASRRDVGVYTGRTQGGPPPWAPAHGYRRKQHVYFPDYYTYYDPNRGYVYWNNGGWVTSSSVPGFLSSVDLGRARIQLLNDVPLTVRPETRYRSYMQTYPARTVNIVVPVPR